MGQVFGIGNCQVDGIVRCAASALGFEADYLHPVKASADPDLLRDKLAGASVVFASRGPIHEQVKTIAGSTGRRDLAVIAAPRFHFAGLHPDATWPGPTGKRLGLPLGDGNSAILLAAWREGLSEAEAISLFREEVYDALGYFEMFELSKQALIEECARTGFDAEPLISGWLERGPFCYVPLHPTIQVLGDIAAALLRAAGLYDGTSVGRVVKDKLAHSGIWPIYPEIGRRIGLAGDTIFRPKLLPDPTPMNLEVFIERTFASWRGVAPEPAAFERLKDKRLENIRRFISSRPTAINANPYRALSPMHWWSKAVAEPEPKHVDPVHNTSFTISKSDKVATAGSCFAQHISKRLHKAGFNYLVTEAAPPECLDPAALDYGVFSARFGNLYTARQLVQLADRAYGTFEPALDAWRVPSGYVDPFRPRIGGGPFASLADLRASREAHFSAVREMFETCDVFVFTLGLTEGWRALVDGAIVPLPPGVVGADALADDYVPINFSVAEIMQDLQSLVTLFKWKNPRARILLTVSPVPLIATHQEQHVLEATTYSKSALRVAAGELASAHAHVAYFPSYEIITGSYNRGRYFAEDLRQVTDEGVDHVMRLFLRHFAGVDPLPVAPSSAEQLGKAPLPVAPSSAEQFSAESRAAMDIICDEEEIEQSVSAQ